MLLHRSDFLYILLIHTHQNLYVRAVASLKKKHIEMMNAKYLGVSAPFAPVFDPSSQF